MMSLTMTLRATAMTSRARRDCDNGESYSELEVWLPSTLLWTYLWNHVMDFDNFWQAN